jgi:hypothetical protein
MSVRKGALAYTADAAAVAAAMVGLTLQILGEWHLASAAWAAGYTLWAAIAWRLG